MVITRSFTGSMRNVFVIDLKRPEYWLRDIRPDGELELGLRYHAPTGRLSLGGLRRFLPAARAILSETLRTDSLEYQPVSNDRFWLTADRRLTQSQLDDLIEDLKARYRLTRALMPIAIDEFDYRNRTIRNAIIEAPNFPPGLGPSATLTIEVDAGYWRGHKWIISGRTKLAEPDQVTLEPFTDRVLDTSLTPEDIGESASIAYRSLAELRQFARQFPSRAAALTTEIHKRLAYPFINIILLLLAVPLVVQPSGQTSLKGIGLAAAAAVGFYIVMLAMLDFGYRGLLPPPLTPLAAWLPPAAFTAIAMWMYRHFHG